MRRTESQNTTSVKTASQTACPQREVSRVPMVSDRISVLVYGQVIATGTPDEIRNNARVKEAYLGEEVAA